MSRGLLQVACKSPPCQEGPGTTLLWGSVSKDQWPTPFVRRDYSGFVSVVLILGLLALQLAAASTCVHERVCPDAAASDHHCAITEFAAGQILTGPIPDLVNAPPVVPFGIIPEPARPNSLFPPLLPFDRGPPCSVSGP